MEEIQPEDPQKGQPSPGMARGISRRRRIIYNTMGLILTGVGIIGIITPVLPTTVFFIMASALFLRSSPRFHRWINSNRVTGPYLRAYTAGEGLSVKRKTGTIVVLWITLGISAWFVRDILWLLILLGVIGIAITIHVATIRPRKPKSKIN